MKSTKKLLCFVLAIAVMVGSMGLVSTVASNTGDTSATTVGLTGDPEYLIKFSKSLVESSKKPTLNELRSPAYFHESDALTDEFVKSDAKAGAKIEVNDNSSITMTKESVTDGTDYQYSTTLEVAVTDEMRANYLKATDKKLYISYWLSNCRTVNAKGVITGYSNYQLRIYTKFKTPYKDDKTDRYLKLSSLGKNDYKMYQPNLNKSFKLLGGDGKALDNLDNVESIIFCLYSFNKNIQATMNVSGVTYAGVPEIPEFVKPEPASATEYLEFGGWSKALLLDYANTPNPIKYCATNNNYESKAFKTLNNEGWLYFNNTTKVPEWQLNTTFNVDPVKFNKAIVTANQPGGEGKIKLKCFFPKIEDTEGKKMQGEFQIRINTFDGRTLDMAQQFIDPGKEYVFEMSTKDLDVNQASTVRIALMAFWNYDPVDDVYYDMGKDQFAKRYNKDGKLMTPFYEDPKDTSTFKGYKIEGSEELLQDSDVAKITTACSDGRKDVDVTAIKDRLTMRTMQNVEAYISPFYTDGGEGAGQNGQTVTTKTTEKTKTTSATKEYKHAGYHVFDFKSEAYAETYGAWTHASFANFLFEDYYESYEIVDYNIEKDGIKQGYKDRKNPMKKVDGDAEYKKDFQEAKSLASGGYQYELKSPYPRRQEQHQAMFHVSGKLEDARLTSDAGDHIPQAPQGEKYDYTEQIKKGIEYAKNHPNPTQNGYVAIDVFVKDCVHGYKNVYDKYKYQSEVTYQKWCKKNGKKCENEKSPIQFLIAIGATTDDGESVSAKVMEFVQYNEKKTLYIDVSELEGEWIKFVQIAAQNYSHLANREQGGDNLSCGITDVQARVSAIYIPGEQNSDLTTTVQVTEAFSKKDAKKIKKLYDALPGLSVDDYETEEDYNKLAAFQKAWSKASDATQKYCEKEYGIDYSEIGMLEMDVWDKLMGSGSIGDDWSDDWDDSYDTGDMAFPMVAMLLVGLSGYVIVKTRKKKED